MQKWAFLLLTMTLEIQSLKLDTENLISYDGERKPSTYYDARSKNYKDVNESKMPSNLCSRSYQVNQLRTAFLVGIECRKPDVKSSSTKSSKRCRLLQSMFFLEVSNSKDNLDENYGEN